MDWSKYYPANYTAITAEDVKMIREKKLAPVDKTAVKQDWDDRSDDNHVDIDNDGDEDSSDKFLHKKRKAITKAVEKEEIDPAIARQKAREAAHKKQLTHQQGGVRKVSIAGPTSDQAQAQREKRQSEDYQDDVKAAWYKGDDAYAAHKDANPQMHKKAPVKKKVSLPAPKSDQERRKDDWYAKKESWRPVDEKRLKQKKSLNKKDYRDDNLKKRVKGIEEPDFSKKQDTVTNMEWAKNVFNNYHDIEEHCGWCDQGMETESKELPTSKGIAKQIKELAKAVRGKDRLSIEGAATLVSKKDYDKLAPYLDKMSEDARQSILMVLMTDQKVANSVMKKMKTEQYDECIIPSHKFILEGMYKKYHELTWGEIGERLIKNTERRLVSLAYATKMGTIDAPSPEVQRLADECELEDLEKASKEYIEDDTDITERVVDEVIEMYNSLNEDEQTSFASFVNQLEDEEVLAELPNFMTHTGRVQNKSDKLTRQADAMQKHQDNLSNIDAEKERIASLKAKQKPGLLKKIGGAVKRGVKDLAKGPSQAVKTAGVRTVKSDADKIADKAVKDQKQKAETQTQQTKQTQTKADQGRAAGGANADKAQQKRMDAENKERARERLRQSKLADDPGLKKAAATSTRGKVLGAVGSAMLGGSYEPEGPLLSEGQSLDDLSTELLKRAAGAAEKDAATQRDAQDYALRVKGKGHSFGAAEAGKKALKRANQATKFKAAADVNDSPYKKSLRAKKEKEPNNEAHEYYHYTKAVELAKKDGHDFDKLPEYHHAHDNHKEAYREKAKQEIAKEAAPERLDARRRIFKEKIKKLAYEKAKEILGKRQPVEPIITKETNKNDKDDDGEGLDAVQPKALKKKFDKRKDTDLDNDGDTDDSDEFIHTKRKAISKAIKKGDNEDETKVKENGKIDNKVKMEPEEEKMKESTGVAFVRKYKNKISETNEDTSLQDQVLELFRSSYASVDGEPVGAEFAVSDEPASASTIARTLRCSPTEVQKLLDDMVQAGQITRVGDAYSYASPRAAEPMGVRPAGDNH